MRFVTGPVPEDPDFEPTEQGWSPIREPDPILLQFLAVPIMIIAGFLVIGFINRYTGLPWLPVAIWAAVLFIPMLPLHELVHALATPSFGRTRQTVIGAWLSHGLFYAHYEGARSRGGFLWCLAAPIVVLTLIPLALCTLPWSQTPALAGLALTNAMGACGDVIGIIVILKEIPRGATVRNKGWRSFYKR